MIVTRSNFMGVLAGLDRKSRLAIDTETTGLDIYGKDHLFSIVIADDKESYYFNFNSYDQYGSDFYLDEFYKLQLKDFLKKERTYFFFNAKFDMGMLAKEDIFVSGAIFDCRVVCRLVNNDPFFVGYTLANCGKFFVGIEKSDKVMEYLLDHELWEWEDIPGKEKRQKRLYFDQVPLDIISQYAEIDGRVTYDLGVKLINELDRVNIESKEYRFTSMLDLTKNEVRLTRTIWDMEQRGVLIDQEYCDKALEYCTAEMMHAEALFLKQTGHKFDPSPLLMVQVFKDETLIMGRPAPKTGKVSPSFDSDALATYKHPAAQTILKYREFKSKHDFYAGFLHYAQWDGRVHASFNQDDTVTGRFGTRNPNLQNLEKSEGSDLSEQFVVRRAIVPSPDYFFAMFDYDQVEYRLLLDRVNSKGLIAKVLGGLDVHQATADIAGVTRSQAKNTNFATIYGAGLGKLAKMLSVDETEARRIRDAIFAASPEILDYTRAAMKTAETRGYVINWYGRRCKFKEPKFAYKAVNHLIQGGCADVIKIAMNRIDHYLKDKRSKLVMTIHDELVIECHKDEADILPEIKKIMEEAYPHRYLPLTVGVEHSFKSLADKVEGYPDGTKTRDEIPREDSQTLS